MSSNDKLPVVLVIGPFDEDWYKICEDCKSKFRIEQALFEDIGISSYEDTMVLSLHPPKEIKYDFQRDKRIISPVLVLVRSSVRYCSNRLGNNFDFRNVLYGIIHGGIPMINPHPAVLYDLERPLMFGLLKEIQRELGEDNFPLIPQTYYSEAQEMIISPEIPFVIKYSYPHAGYGKIRVLNSNDFDDIRSIVAIDNYYCAAEPLIDADYELRIAFIAPDYYRVHKRKSGNWKVNFGFCNTREDFELKPLFKSWVDEIRKRIPGMDCFAIDAIVDKNGKHYILEVNGSAQGFDPDHEDEYLSHLKKLVVSRFDEIMNKKKENLKETDIVESDSSVENINLKNEIEFLNIQIQKKDKKIEELQNVMYIKTNRNYERNHNRDISMLFIVITSILILILCFKYFK